MVEEIFNTEERTDSAALARVFSALGNINTGLGTGRDKGASVAINIDPYILDREELSALPRQSAILKRVICLYPEDAAADWINFTFGKSKENPAVILDYMRDLALKEGHYSVREAFKEASIIGRQHGDGFCLLGVADGRVPSAPIDWDAINSLRWIKPMSRYQLMPDRMMGADVKHPKFYVIKSHAQAVLPNTEGQKQVMDGSIWHSDRVLRFPGERLYDDALISNGGYNDSILQAMFNAWSAYQQGLMASSAMLADYSQMVFKSERLAEQVSTSNNGARNGENKVLDRLLALDMGRSVAKAILIDKSLEDAEYVNRTYGGADSILKALLEDWVAASDMPGDKLLGRTSASGISNHPGEQTRFEWALCVAQWQETNWRSHLEYVCRIIMLASDGPTGGTIPDGWGLSFKDTLKLTRKEDMELRLMVAERDEKQINLGIYSVEEARNSEYGGAEFSAEVTLSQEVPTTDDARTDYSYVQRVLKYQGMELGIEDKPGDRHKGKRLTGVAYAHLRRHKGSNQESLKAYVSEALIDDLHEGNSRNGDRYFKVSQKSGADLYFFGFSSRDEAQSTYLRYYPAFGFDGVDEVRLTDVQALRGDAVELFVPEQEVLPSVNELLALSDVSAEDVAATAKLWRDNPPDVNFGSILDALEDV